MESPSTSPSEPAEDVIGDLLPAVFAPMARRDQRLRGEQYIRGLISVSGRKSMRNIATLFGGGAVQQGLQHFISSSSWDWLPVRRSLAHYLEQAMTQRAWVVQSMFVAKSGTSSVGVERNFVPGLGQSVNSQQAFGVWLASESASTPVNWGLFLSAAWLADDERRQKVGIPRDREAGTLGGCACRAVLAVAEDWQTRRRPVVLDIAGLDARDCLRRFSEAGVPVILSVDRSLRVTVEDPSVPGYGRGELTVRQIVDSVAALRRPASWVDPDGGAVRTSFVAAVPVRPTRSPANREAGAEAPPLLLFADWSRPGTRPTRLWLTDLTGASPAALLRMTKLTRRVDHDVSRISEHVGLRDFEGRSFQGWHRHMTLVSIAHAATILSESETDAVSYGLGGAA